MVSDFLLPDEENQQSIDDVIDEGIAIGAYKKEVGWDHEGLVRLLRNRGILAYRQEFVTRTKLYEKKMITRGLLKIKETLSEEELPVIVSVEAGFDENTFSHLIVVTGYEADENGVKGLYYHDPDAREGKKENLFVDKDKFFQYWRKFCIFVEN
jgi:hypothetical protein